METLPLLFTEASKWLDLENWVSVLARKRGEVASVKSLKDSLAE
jgi:hypothetical protein